MKIRTITYFLPGEPTPDGIRSAAAQVHRLADRFNAERPAGRALEIQTLRISLPNWDRGLGRLAPAQRTDRMLAIAQACRDQRIDYCGVGLARDPEQILHMAEVLPLDEVLYGGSDCADLDRGLDPIAVEASVRAINRLALYPPVGWGNFQFAAGFCIPPDTPYFPVGYQAGPDASFAIAFENSDAVVAAFAGASSVEVGRARLQEILGSTYKPFAAAAQRAGDEIGVRFGGIDTSIAPSVEPGESLVHAFESVGVPFGAVGTLRVCAALTQAVKAIDVPQCGYCGLMLSVMEDHGLAGLSGSGQYTVATILAGSAVCGVGIDMVPLTGDVTADQIARLLGDVGALATRLRKPLSVRILPVPGKKLGDWTEFDSPFIRNTAVFTI